MPVLTAVMPTAPAARQLVTLVLTPGVMTPLAMTRMMGGVTWQVLQMTPLQRCRAQWMRLVQQWAAALSPALLLLVPLQATALPLQLLLLRLMLMLPALASLPCAVWPRRAAGSSSGVRLPLSRHVGLIFRLHARHVRLVASLASSYLRLQLATASSCNCCWTARRPQPSLKALCVYLQLMFQLVLSAALVAATPIRRVLPCALCARRVSLVHLTRLHRLMLCALVQLHAVISMTLMCFSLWRSRR